MVVDGRVRDVSETSTLRIPVWARATSAVGAGLAAQAHRINMPVVIGDVGVNPVCLSRRGRLESDRLLIPSVYREILSLRRRMAT